jgi:predicted RNase H-like nuclease (RuvC/YqgF family)
MEMSSLQEKMERIAAERERLAREEAAMRDEAMAELDRINSEIEALEQKKDALEAFLGLDDGAQRAGHGQITQLCLRALASSTTGMTAGDVKDWIEADSPGTRVVSVPAALSRLMSQGRLRRDDAGRYFAV